MSATMIAASMRRATGRTRTWTTAVGGVFLASGSFLMFLFVYTLGMHVTFTERVATRVFRAFERMAWWSVYRDILEDVVVPNALAFVLVVAVFQLVVALAILAGALATRIGLAAATLWALAVVPALTWGYAVLNLALAAGLVVLMLNGPLGARRRLRSVSR